MTIFGIDVAAGGADKSVCCVRQDNVVLPLIRWTKMEPMESVGIIMRLIARYKPDKAIMDAEALGAGIYGRLKELEAPVLPYHGKNRCDLKDESGELTFTNWRSYAWWHMRDLLNPENDYNLALPKDDDLIGELCSPKWKLTSTGRLQVEPKEEVCKRLGRSTDAADAVTMAFCEIDASEFENAWTIYESSQTPTRRLRPDEVDDEESRRRESDAVEKALWSIGTPVDIFHLF